jgi:hypothetical protein
MGFPRFSVKAQVIAPGRMRFTLQAIAGKWCTGLRRIFVRHQGATSGASSNDVSVERNTENGRKDKQGGMSFDRNRLRSEWIANMVQQAFDRTVSRRRNLRASRFPV